MISQLLHKIEELILDNISGDEEREYYALYKQLDGATDEELYDFENELNIKLPDDFTALYRIKNGSAYPFQLLYTTYKLECVSAFYLLSLNNIRKAKAQFCNEDKLMSEFDDYFSEEDINKLDKRIKPCLFNKKWLPFAQMVGGSIYLMLDFDPTAEGAIGQIIIYIHDPDFIYYVRKNIEELLKDTIENLEHGWYEELHY